MLEIASVQDLDEMLKIDNEIFGDISWTRDFMLKSLEFGYFVKKTIDSRIVGFVGIRQSFEIADLITLCVVPKFRKRGIASELIDEIISYSSKNNIETLILEVHNKNLVAINLYKSKGFRIEKTIENYYKGERAFLMVKKL